MLSTMRSSWLLFALMVLVALSSAFKVEDALHVDGINAYLHHGVRRQADGTGAASSEPTRSSSPPSEPSSTDEPSSTPDPEPSSSPAPAQSSSESSSEDDSAPSTPAPGPSTTPPSATQTSASSTRDNVQSTPSATPKPSQSIITKPLISTEVLRSTTIIEIVTDGSTRRQTSVGSRTIEHTTGTTTETALSNSNGGGGSDGLSSEKKAIIGGVIGGVGGAILLGGIAIVCWRMWGKKKRVSEDDADLMAGTGAALGDKSSTASPFHNNLEQYHNPGGRPNAAANF